MLTGADLKAFRTFAGIPSYKIAKRLGVPFARIMDLEASEKVNIGWMSFRWLWFCCYMAIPNFLYKAIDPMFFSREADNQLLGYFQHRILPGLAMLLLLLPFYLFFLIGIYYFSIPSYKVYSYIYCCICLLVLWVNKASPNIVSLVVLLLFARALEIFAFSFISRGGPYEQYYISALYLAIDFLMVAAVAFRPAIFRLLEKFVFGHTSSSYQITRADTLIGAIYQLYLWISFFTLGEHILRHLDHIGLPYSQWLYENARFFWSNSAYIKLPLNALEFVALLTTINWRLSRYQA